MRALEMIETIESQLENKRRDYEEIAARVDAHRKSLAKMENLLSRTKTDIEGLEMAAEALKSTSMVKLEIENAEARAGEKAAFDQHKQAAADAEDYARKKTMIAQEQKSINEKPLKKRGGKRLNVKITVFDQYKNIKARYPSMNEAKKGMKWTASKIYNALELDEKTQLNRFGFFIARD